MTDRFTARADYEPVPADAEALAAALTTEGIEPSLADRLAAYGALLLAANRQVNLTGAKDVAALVPHVLDALTLEPEVRAAVASAEGAGRTPWLADVGSGGGLPGIPLGLALPGLYVVLIEPVRKKAAFLAAALRRAGLPGEASPERAEAAAREPRYREQADVATARAVSGASTVLELTAPLVRVGGWMLLQRGATDAAERRALEDAAPILGTELVAERLLPGERRIFVLRKVRASGERFPRRNGIPEKRPLCVDGVR